MDFLDELKKETRAADLARRQEEAVQEERQQAFRVKAQSRLKDLYDYFKQIIDTLKNSSYEIRTDYELVNFGTLAGYLQGNYQLVAEEPQDMHRLSLMFDCSGPEEIVFAMEQRKKIMEQREYMWANALRFEFVEKMGRESAKEMSGEFHLEPRIPVKIIFELNDVGETIKLTLKNLDQIGEHTHTLKPDMLDKRFMEEIGRAIVRKPNQLYKMMGYEVSDMQRMAFQDEIRRSQKEKAAKIKAGEQRRRVVEQEEKKKKGFLSTVKLFVGKNKNSKR